MRANQLAPIFPMIFNGFLELSVVLSSFKGSTLTLVPKKPSPTGTNEYEPIALTSVVMKTFQRLVLRLLKDIIGPLDPIPWIAGVSPRPQYILDHLNSPGTNERTWLWTSTLYLKPPSQESFTGSSPDSQCPHPPFNGLPAF